MKNIDLVGGFNPIEKICLLNWIISPGRDKNQKYLKPPARYYISRKYTTAI